MRDKLKLSGGYKIEIKNAVTGRVLSRLHIKNQLTAVNQTVRAQMLAGTYTGGINDLQIKYFAFGTDSTPASAAQTSLVSEQFRKQVTSLSSSGGVTSSLCSLGTGDANFNIREIGVFAGPSASAAAGSGTMISRVVVDIDKNSNIVINITRSDVCAI